MSRRKLSRSDRALLDSAWAEVARAPRARVGRSSLMRSAVFTARYPGVCGRCGFLIRIGQDVRVHHDFDGVVHDGCREPEVFICTAVGGPPRRASTAAAAGARQPQLCPLCCMYHSGKCL